MVVYIFSNTSKALNPLSVVYITVGYGNYRDVNDIYEYTNPIDYLTLNVYDFCIFSDFLLTTFYKGFFLPLSGW